MKVKKVSSALRTLILDGYNVIHAVPELEKLLDSSLQAAREGLIQSCERYKAVQGNIHKIVIVFDGQSEYDGLPSGSRAGIEIVFTSGESADEKILEIIQDSRDTDSFIVVSNDNYISNNSRAMRTAVVPVSQFHGAVFGEKRSNGSRTGSKSSLSAHAAQQITNEYRKYLGL